MKIFAGMFLILALGYGLFAQDDNNNSERNWGEVEGVVRLYHIFDAAYIKTGRETDYDIDGSTTGGHIRYHTPEYANIGASTAVYYARGTGLNDKGDPDTIMGAGRFFTEDYSPKAVWGEINLHYKDKQHYGIIGRYKIDSPLTNAIYTYMPNMFQAALYENSSLDSTKITIAQIEKMAYGSRTPVEFGLIGEVTRTAGTTQNGIDTRGEFLDIEKQTLGDADAKTNGLTSLGIVNDSITNTTVRIWDFYAHDILNMFYLDAVYKQKVNSLPFSLSAQYLRNDSVGDNLAAKWMDSNNAYMMGVKATLKYKKSFFYLAYNHSGNSKILNPWGGDPAYTSSFFSRNAYRANVDAYKIGFNYDILNNLKLITSHADYGRSTTLGTFSPAKPVELPLKKAEDDARESVFLLSYAPIESLTVLGGVIYKTSEYFYAGKQVEALDVDLVITYKF